jgi:hypothetical protein
MTNPHPNRGARELSRTLEKRGLRQKDAALLADLDEGKLSRLLSEKALPNRAESIRIRAEFGIDVALWDQPPTDVDPGAA